MKTAVHITETSPKNTGSHSSLQHPNTTPPLEAGQGASATQIHHWNYCTLGSGQAIARREIAWQQKRSVCAPL